MTVDQIKRHPFFYGVDWLSIREIAAPFVPNLKSITDTSYFPTDEIEQVEEVASESTGDASKDLAFLGYVRRLSERQQLHPNFADIHSNDFRYHRMHFNGTIYYFLLTRPMNPS